MLYTVSKTSNVSFKLFLTEIHPIPSAEIRENTTLDLISDMEKLRKELNIDKWILFGGSWGSCLSLIYAINYP
ncbi:hypothetical protein PIGBHMHK_00257 [Mycoplasmopsis arginini]|nr:alpha/beta fold hydrolase [Mycoplasmopsis arginini]MDI3348507.1 hypothetical protein [Mycoplasmopsis arginini]MDI3348935.1 hypothetical protein [Mycoplasmopsis arginini]